ncbi:protein phosphatase 2C domain-containing protein [Dactylosporangium sp. NBC_01737]|uniref:protein phosphatase 2C domain-containing protein n=1 Tax=Dactylosporangium sp. NBC_01737 TaxID=2975959 RepID=UPI002E10AF93|nr:protein phosphatase 2C domain-containing protein [Dactylosporangium sp. NBC_01737]
MGRRGSGVAPLAAYAGVPAIGLAGRAASELPAGPPPALSGAADHELSACSLPGMEVRAASVRGLMHRYREEPRQDCFSLVPDDRTGGLLVTVCDGVGSLKRSQEAASFVAARAPREFLACGSWSKAIAAVNEGLTELAEGALASAPPGSHTPDFGMSTTFVGVAVSSEPERPDADGTSAGAGPTGWAVSIAWTDDSTVWLLRDGQWTNLTPAGASSADADPSIHSTRVRALPHPDPQVKTVEMIIDQGALFVMTDGVGVPLESASEVRGTLAGWWSTPPDVFTFGRQVGFARKGHQDDRTVVGVWLAPNSGR